MALDDTAYTVCSTVYAVSSTAICFFLNKNTLCDLFTATILTRIWNFVTINLQLSPI